MSRYEPIQQIQPHTPDCAMLNGLNGDQPWCLPTQTTDGLFSTLPVGRDLTGRRNRNARHTWVVFRCSDPGCPAKLAVYWEYAVRQLNLSDPKWKREMSA